MQYVYERTVASPHPAADVFANLDDVEKLARHMSKRSAAMLGSRLDLIVDRSRSGVGQRYGWRGSVLGLKIRVDEEVTVYNPPFAKRWCTVGPPELVVISRYCMSFEVQAAAVGSVATLRLDYDLPSHGWQAFAGRLFGHAYARWCVDRMAADLGA